MSEYGLKIKNIKAASLFEYYLGLRESYQTTPAMFSNSLFSDFIRANGMASHKGESTRDILELGLTLNTFSILKIYWIMMPLIIVDIMIYSQKQPLKRIVIKNCPVMNFANTFIHTE